MGAPQSKIRGTAQVPADSTVIKDFVKSSFSNLCHIDSTETLTQHSQINGLTVAPNRFTLKAILKNTKDSVDSGCVLDSPQSSKSSVGFQLDEFEKPPQPTSCWSCYRSQEKLTDNNLLFESYSSSAKSSTSQPDSLRSMRMSTASLSSRRSLPQFEQPPIYQSTSGEYYVAFDESRFVLSNEFNCPNGITVDGHFFQTSEQCYLYQKALFHGNKQLAEQILHTTDVRLLKKMMTPIDKAMSHDKWNKVEVGIMRRTCLAKFSQNPTLRTELFRTGSATLVFATEDDCKWGIGLCLDDSDLADVNNWKGSNLLGQVLSAVRSVLAAQYHEDFRNEQLVVEKRQLKYAQKCE
ncbi:NADAR domain-containing protein [Aphelenchoides bicaudatus]|nr:NADAR domain-containing protein [Aphelenchoides bicaudatus]